MPDRVEDLIRQAAKKYNISENLPLAVAEQESGFNPNALNPDSGAMGVFQFIPSTAKSRGIDASDPRTNIDEGVKYLRELMDSHQGNVDAVLAEYGGVKTDTTYVPAVKARLSKFKTAPEEDSRPPMQATPPPAAARAGMKAASTATSEPPTGTLMDLIPPKSQRTADMRAMTEGAAGAIPTTGALAATRAAGPLVSKVGQGMMRIATHPATGAAVGAYEGGKRYGPGGVLAGAVLGARGFGAIGSRGLLGRLVRIAAREAPEVEAATAAKAAAREGTITEQELRRLGRSPILSEAEYIREQNLLKEAKRRSHIVGHSFASGGKTGIP